MKEPTKKPRKKSSAGEDDILVAARERMELCVDAERDQRGRDMDDLQKLIGEQWPDNIRREREAEGKPCITLNRLPQFVRQVTGDIRRMNPAINVTPSDDDATEEIAEIMEGLIRNIEQRCDASSVYETAAESAAACSIGWFRVTNDWRDDQSFEQEISIKRIRNPFSVYCDPSAETETRNDAEFIFITEAMDADDFKTAYPNAKLVDVRQDETTIRGAEHWREAEKVIVAEYYWKERSDRTLLMLVDGSTLFEDEAAQEVPEAAITRRRKVSAEKVMWAKISGAEVLEGPVEVPCKYIPVIAVIGEEWHVGAERYRSSVIRFAKDAQQLYNYFRSSQAELVTMQPKAPYIGTLKQFEGLQTYWQNANVKNYSYLPYNPDDRAPGPPQRQQPPVSSQGMMEQALAAADDMKATTGIYDAALGNKSNEQSGIAIRQRQMESDVSTSIYTDNMAKAITQCGRVLLSMIPRVYDTARLVRITNRDEKEQLVPVNGMNVEAGEPSPVNDLTIGTYDLRVSVGPNYSTRRQETQEGMLEFIRVVPGAAQVIGDLIAKAMDWPDADVIAERLEKVLPPGMKKQEDMTPEEQQAMAAQMQEQQQVKQMAQAAAMIEMREKMAKTAEAEADAEKTKAEAIQTQMEVALQSGALNEVIRQAVMAQLAAMLQPQPHQGMV